MSGGPTRRALRLERFRHDGLRWLAESSASDAIRARSDWQALAADAEFRLIQATRDRAVHTGWLRGGAAPLHLIAKSMRYPRLRQRLGHVLRRTRAAREFHFHSIAFRCGLPAVRPLALGECRRMGAPVASVLVAEYWDHDSTLADIARAPGGTQALPRLLEALGRAVREMHRVGLFHHDLRPGNVLVRLAGDADLRVVDWKHVRRSFWPRRAQAWSQLGKLAWQFESAGIFRAAAPEREAAFYTGYTGGDAGEVRSAVALWLAKTRARLGARAARRCTEANSGFARVDVRDLVGFVRRGAFPESLLTPETLRAAAASGSGIGTDEPGVTISVRELAPPTHGDPLALWREANRAHASQPLSPRPVAWLEERSSRRAAWLCTRDDGDRRE